MEKPRPIWTILKELRPLSTYVPPWDGPSPVRLKNSNRTEKLISKLDMSVLNSLGIPLIRSSTPTSGRLVYRTTIYPQTKQDACLSMRFSPKQILHKDRLQSKTLLISLIILQTKGLITQVRTLMHWALMKSGEALCAP